MADLSLVVSLSSAKLPRVASRSSPTVAALGWWVSGRGAIAFRQVSEEPGKTGATVGVRHVLDGRSGGKLMLIATTTSGAPAAVLSSLSRNDELGAAAADTSFRECRLH